MLYKQCYLFVCTQSLLFYASTITAHTSQPLINQTKDIMTSNAQSLSSWFKTTIANKSFMDQLTLIKLLIVDIDGSLTDGRVECSATSEGTRYFSTQDGYGIKQLMNNGFLIAFISGKACESGKQRARVLGIPDELCILGTEAKNAAVTRLQKQFNLTSENILVFGDDIIDAQVKVAQPNSLFVCPSNSPFYIQALADRIVPCSGGNDAFRLLADLMLYQQGTHQMQQVITQTLAQ